MLGNELARLYVSGSFDSVTPIAHAMTAMRPKPVTRESAVPMLIATVARASDGPASSVAAEGGTSSGPVRGGEGSSEDIRARVSAAECPGGGPFVHSYAVSAGGGAGRSCGVALVSPAVCVARARRTG